jgi:hypothetical protein
MKKKKKQLFLNIVLVFGLCFSLLFLLQAYQDYNFYRVYSIKELAEYFSMSKTLIWYVSQALYWSMLQMIIFVPVLILLEKTTLKNVYKILIALCITFIFSIIYLIRNLTFTF